MCGATRAAKSVIYAGVLERDELSMNGSLVKGRENVTE